MKKIVFKTMVAVVCVVAAGMGSLKAYNAANQAESNMLFTENVEALAGSEGTMHLCCYFAPGYTCYCNGYCFINYRNIW